MGWAYTWANCSWYARDNCCKTGLINGLVICKLYGLNWTNLGSVAPLFLFHFFFKFLFHSDSLSLSLSSEFGSSLSPWSQLQLDSASSTCTVSLSLSLSLSVFVYICVEVLIEVFYGSLGMRETVTVLHWIFE